MFILVEQEVESRLRCDASVKQPGSADAISIWTASHRGYPAGQACRSCAAGCASCGKNATHCLSCEEPLLLHKHQCAEECPPAHAVGADGECRRCPSACQECQPLGECTGTESGTRSVRAGSKTGVATQVSHLIGPLVCYKGVFLHTYLLRD